MRASRRDGSSGTGRLPRGSALREAKTGGFTIVEMLVVLAVALVVVGALYQLMMGQSRLYMKQDALMDVRASMRAASTLLAWELRQASAAGGDVYAIDQSSVTLRSIEGSGVICGEHVTQPRYAIWGTTGEFSTTATDSALLFAAGAKGTQDDTWRVVALTNKWTTGGGDVSCVWDDGLGGNVVPDLVVEVAGNTNEVKIGGAIRAFRKVEYSIYQDQGRWWLGRKVADASAFEMLTGPLRSSADSGLAFVYYDANGNTTADPAAVAMVDIILRGESLRKAPRVRQDPGFQQDTLTLRVWLRN